MAKEILEIQSFNKGTILNADDADIPMNAAGYSLNIDSNSEAGRLKGVPKDVFIAFFEGDSFQGVITSADSGDLASLNHPENPEPQFVVYHQGAWRLCHQGAMYIQDNT